MFVNNEGYWNGPGAVWHGRHAINRRRGSDLPRQPRRGKRLWQEGIIAFNALDAGCRRDVFVALTTNRERAC